MFKQKIEEDLKKAIKDLGYEPLDIVCDIPKNSAFGDYTSNVALQLANQKEANGKQNPREIANEIATRVWGLGSSQEYLEKVEVAGSGFLNFFIKSEALMENLHKVCDYASFVNPEIDLDEEKKKILVEYAHPNTHKAFHIGHVRNITLGESLARLLSATGNEVFRANYQGDIGLHVAKALWGVKKLESEGIILLNLTNLKQKAEFLGKAYALGATEYEKNDQTKKEIVEINKKLYLKDPAIVPLWEQTRKWSLDYFNDIYQKFGVSFDRLFFESEVEERGKELVTQNIGKIFEEDQGAVVFKAEKSGLHTRVLLTQEGNPTYEAKELGLGEAEKEAFDFDKAIHVVGNDQAGYLQVMFKALEELDSWFKEKEVHLSYGLVNLSTGKMASRTGNVITFDWLYDQVQERANKIATSSPSASPRNDNLTDQEKEEIILNVSLGAIKFSMLKYSPGTDITFDIEKSVSLQGDSGPYVQYSYARAKSVLRNAKYDYQVDLPHAEKHTKSADSIEIEERELLRLMEHFEVVVNSAAESLSPNKLAEYLLDLSKAFNLFYQKHQILNSEFRLALTCSVAVVLKQGLNLLGIESPERM